MGKVRCMGWFFENDMKRGKHGLKRPKNLKLPVFTQKRPNLTFLAKNDPFDPKTGFSP